MRRTTLAFPESPAVGYLRDQGGCTAEEGLDPGGVCRSGGGSE